MTTRKLKRPNGDLCEEFLTLGSHTFVDSILVDHVTDADGEYTGVFWFEYPDGRCTRRYTTKTAPAWLLAMYREATSTLFSGVTVR